MTLSPGAPQSKVSLVLRPCCSTVISPGSQEKRGLSLLKRGICGQSRQPHGSHRLEGVRMTEGLTTLSPRTPVQKNSCLLWGRVGMRLGRASSHHRSRLHNSQAPSSHRLRQSLSETHFWSAGQSHSGCPRRCGSACKGQSDMPPGLREREQPFQ